MIDIIEWILNITVQIIEVFIEEYKNESESFSFHKIFNEYFNNRNPAIVDLEKLDSDVNLPKDLASLIRQEILDKIYTSKALENDINVLQEIVNGNYPIKSFDYDGEKFNSKKATLLIPRLISELEEMNLELEKLLKFSMKIKCRCRKSCI